MFPTKHHGTDGAVHSFCLQCPKKEPLNSSESSRAGAGRSCYGEREDSLRQVAAGAPKDHVCPVRKFHGLMAAEGCKMEHRGA